MQLNLPYSQSVAGRIGSDINLVILIVGSVCFLPFYYSSATIDPVLLPRFFAWSLLSIFLILGIIFQIKSNENGFDFSIATRAIFYPIAGYTVIAGLSIVNAVNFSAGLFEWLKVFLGFAFFYMACLILNRNKEGFHLVAVSITLAGLTLALIGILQYHEVAFTKIPGNYWIYATLANKNLLASALFLTLPFVFWGMLRFSGVGLVISHISIGCIFYAISLTEARSVWFALLLSSAFIVFVFSRIIKNLKLDRRQRKKLLKRCLAAISLICLAILIAFLTPHPQPIANPDSLSNDGDSIPKIRIISKLPLWSLNSLGERFQLWQTSLRMITKNPLLGVGTGQWKIMLPRYGEFEKLEMDGDGIIEIQFQRPHNDYLWVLSENGVIGFVCYIFFYIILVFYALKIAVKSEKTDTQIFALLMLFGLCGYMFIAFFSFPKERVVHTIFQMLIAASIVTVYHETFPTRRTVSHRKMQVFNFVILVFLFLSGFIGHVRLTSEIHTRNGLEARLKADWDKVIVEMDRAYSRFYSLDPTATPLKWYRGMAHYALGHIEEARDDFNQAYRIHPYHVHVLNNLATCHALLNDMNSAVEYYTRTLEAFPRFETSVINLCSLYLAMGKYTAANDILQRFGQEQTSDAVAAIAEQVKNRLKNG